MDPVELAGSSVMVVASKKPGKSTDSSFVPRPDEKS
jgi:hypothetical protein